MRRSLVASALASALCAGAAAQDKPRTPAEIAAKTETEATAAWRYRTAIAGLLQLKPGMVAAEIGTGTAFVARAMASQVAPNGRVISAALDRDIDAFTAERAKSDGVQNFSTLVVNADGAGLEPASLDAVAIVSAFGDFTARPEMLRSVAAALKPGGALVIVDLPAESVGSRVVGIDADDVVQLARAAGLNGEAESTALPAQY